MTLSVEQSLQAGLDRLEAKFDTLMAALLGDPKFGEGRIPALERRVHDHEDRIGELEDAQEVEKVTTQVMLTFKEKFVALLVGAPVFIHYGILVLRDLKLLH